MKINSFLLTLFALLSIGCAGMQDAPEAEVRRALAPTGKLRVALFEANAVQMVKDRASGETKGVAHDLGKALALRMGVPFEPIIYPTLGEMLNGAKAGAWDVAFIGIAPERRKFLDFAGNHLEVEFGYLVLAGSKLSRIDEIDHPERRVAVVEKGTPDVFLTGTLKNATLVRTPALSGALNLLGAGKADVLGGIKPNMYAVAAKLPGSRVLDGRPGFEEQGLAVPKGRGAAALAYAGRFIEEAKADGIVKQAIERAGLRGVVVAPRNGLQ